MKDLLRRALGVNLREPNKRQQLNFAIGKVTSAELVR